MKVSDSQSETTALVTSDWLVRAEGKTEATESEATPQRQPNRQFSKEQIMKRFFKFLKKQEVALAVALMTMVAWSGFAMTEAFNHLA